MMTTPTLLTNPESSLGAASFEPGPTVLIVQNYESPYRSALFARLAECGLSITVNYLQRPEDEGRRWSSIESTAYEVIRCFRLKLAKLVLFWIPAAVRSRSFDFVILLDNLPTNLCLLLWTRLLSRRAGKMLLWVEHINDVNANRLKRTVRLWFTRFLASRCDGVISFSAMSTRYLSYCGCDPVIQLRQAAELPKFCASRKVSSIRTFGFLGSAAARKNLGLLLQAFSHVESATTRLLVAGVDGDAGQPGVAYLGYVDGIAKAQFFEDIDVLILPSNCDPWGLVVNEALEYGRLAAASTGCGSSELTGAISDKLVFEPTLASISAMLLELNSLSQSEVEQLLARGAGYVAAYSVESVALAMSKGLKLFASRAERKPEEK